LKLESNVLKSVVRTTEHEDAYLDQRALVLEPLDMVPDDGGPVDGGVGLAGMADVVKENAFVFDDPFSPDAAI
jgi:hypothetical protein